jgi:hypothetical protein
LPQNMDQWSSAGNSPSANDPAAADAWQQIGAVARRLVRRVIDADRREATEGQVTDA